MYYKYHLKQFKLQGKIPVRQSCCEHCQNFKVVIEEMCMYMAGIPHTLGDCIDSSICPYITYFPKINCVLQTCPNCGITKLKDKLMKLNKGKMKDKCQQFLVKQWETRSEIKNGERSSYLVWKI